MNEQQRQRPWIAGVVLIAFGILLFGAQWFDVGDAVVLGGVSAIFLALFAGTRAYGWLVPGMILAGIAVGVGVQDAGYDENGGAVVLGLGAAFSCINIANLLVARGPAHWWPLIPGTILTTVGGSLVFGGTQAGEAVGRLWPVGLVIAGLLVLLAPRAQGKPTS